MDNPLYYFIFFPILIIFSSPLVLRIIPIDLNEQSGRDKNLEGLRGLLAPSVFFHHALITFFYYSEGKWEAPASAFYNKLGPGPVTIFFFMTGYLFWEQNKLSTKTFSVKDFLLRRFYRLVPGYYFSLALIVFFVFCYSDFKVLVSLQDFLISILPWIFFGLPLGKFPDINSFTDTALINASVAWTLRYEWIFYLTFGITRKFSTLSKFIFFTIIILILKRLLDISYIHETFDSDSTGFLLIEVLKNFFFFMIIGFNFGVLTSFLKHDNYIKFVSHWVSALIGIMCLLSYFFIDQIPAYSEFSSFLLFIFFVTTILNKRAVNLLQWRGFQALGHISYSVYLLHGIALFVGFRIVNQFTQVKSLPPLAFWLLTLIIGFFTLLVSSFSYRWIEHPLMRKRTRK